MTKYIGILTAGGDSPGLNAAIRGVGKAAQQNYDMRIIGFRDGFPGLVENRTVSLVQAIKQRIANVETAEDKKARKQAKKELRELETGFNGVMVAARGESAVPVPLEEVAGNTKLVPADHPWAESARRVGVSLGD